MYAVWLCTGAWNATVGSALARRAWMPLALPRKVRVSRAGLRLDIDAAVPPARHIDQHAVLALAVTRWRHISPLLGDRALGICWQRPRQGSSREYHPEFPKNNASARARLSRIFPERLAKASGLLLSRGARLVTWPWEQWTRRRAFHPFRARNPAPARAPLPRIFPKTRAEGRCVFPLPGCLFGSFFVPGGAFLAKYQASTYLHE